MKNLFAALAIAMFVASPVAMAQNANNSNAVASGGAAGSGSAAVAGYGTLAALSTAALVGGVIALANSGDDDDENVQLGAGGTTGTVGTSQ